MGRKYRRYTRNKRPVTLGDLEPKASYYRGFAPIPQPICARFRNAGDAADFRVEAGRFTNWRCQIPLSEPLLLLSIFLKRTVHSARSA